MSAFRNIKALSNRCISKRDIDHIIAYGNAHEAISRLKQKRE